MTDQPDIDPATDTSADDTLPPSEATDPDQLRNDDGDATVTPPDHWQGIDPAAPESLDDKLAAERPEYSGRHRGQVSGSPEDGDSLFTVEK